MKWLKAHRDIVAQARKVIDSVEIDERTRFVEDLQAALQLLEEAVVPAIVEREFGEVSITIMNDYGALECIGPDTVKREGMKAMYDGTVVQEFSALSTEGGVRFDVKITRNLNGKMPKATPEEQQVFETRADWIDRYGDPEAVPEEEPNL